jgi:hypothetical protein
VDKVQFPWGIFLEPWSYLEVVVQCVVSPITIILNDVVTYEHISGSKLTPMSFNLKKTPRVSSINWTIHLKHVADVEAIGQKSKSGWVTWGY